MKKLSFVVWCCLALSYQAAYSQTTFYSEDFTGQVGDGYVNNTTTITGNWTLDVSNTGNQAIISVNVSEQLEFDRMDGSGIWLSPVLNINGMSSLTLSMTLTNSSQKNNSASAFAEYQLDGGAWTAFSNNGAPAQNFGTVIATQTIASGSTLRLRFRSVQSHANDIHILDNVSVVGTLDAMIYSGGAWNFTPNLTAASANSNITVAANETVTLPAEVLATDLTVESGAVVTIQQLELSGNISNNGVVNIPNNSTLVQTSASNGNTGSGTYSVARQHAVRDSAAITVYSSPITSANIENVFSASGWRFAWDDVAQNFIFYNTGVMTPGRGYSITPDTNVRNSSGLQSITFNGIVNNGPVTYNIASLNGGDWVQIGNPYPSSIDWTEFLNDNPDILGTYFVWDETSDNTADRGYASHNGSGGTNGNNSKKSAPTQFIPAMQGFFARVDTNFAGGALNIRFENDQRSKTDNTQSNFRKSGLQRRVWIALESDSSKNQILLNFDDLATDGLDSKYDGQSLKGNGYHNLHFQKDGFDLAILGTNYDRDSSYVFSLGTNFSQEAAHEFYIDSLNGWDLNVDLYLFDKDLDIYHNLNSGPYKFNIEETGTYDNRFELHIGKAYNVGLKNFVHSDFLWFQREQQIYLRGDFTAVKSIEIISLEGKLIQNQSVVYPSSSSVKIEASTIPSGVYLIRMLTSENAIASTIKIYKN